MTADLCHLVDKFQSHSPEAVYCGTDVAHGRMLYSPYHKAIVCGMCGLNYPLSSDFLAAVVAFGK